MFSPPPPGLDASSVRRRPMPVARSNTTGSLGAAPAGRPPLPPTRPIPATNFSSDSTSKGSPVSRIAAFMSRTTSRITNSARSTASSDSPLSPRSSPPRTTSRTPLSPPRSSSPPFSTSGRSVFSPPRSSIRSVMSPTRYTRDVLSPSKSYNRDVLSPTRSYTRDVLSPTRPYSRDMLSPTRSNSRDVLSPTRSSSRDLLSPTRSTSRDVLSPSRASTPRSFRSDAFSPRASPGPRTWSPSPSVGSTSSYKHNKASSGSGFLLPLRRFFPQSSPPLSQSSSSKSLASLDGGSSSAVVKKKLPGHDAVIINAGLSFIVNCKAKLKQQFEPRAAHTDPASNSAELTDKIQNFLKRTDHVMEEWRALGKGEDSTDIALKCKGSRSATNILIKGYQLSHSGSLGSSRTSRRGSMSQATDTDWAIDEMDEMDELSELTADLAEEHSMSTLATERLEAETAERLRVEKDLQNLQNEHRTLQQSTERLEMDLLLTRAAEMNGTLGSEDDGDDGGGSDTFSLYKQKYERVAKELEFTRRRLQQQHEDDLEQLVGLKKHLEKKLADAYEEVEEQRQVVAQWKRKVQKLTGEMNDIRLLLEEQNSRNTLLEKKQRKFDSELQMMQEELRREKQTRDRITREKDICISEKMSLEQNMSALKLELELKEEKLAALSRELDDMTFSGKTEEEVASLRKSKHELEMKIKDQEEELDDLAGQVQLLEQAKLRLEMSLEQQRKEHRKELSQRDDELEEGRCNAQKKVKSLECQLENEHEERTQLLREKHELERRLSAAEEAASRAADEEQIQRLRRDLKRTKALLKDAQTMLERAKGDTPSKVLLRQLRNQLEDAEFTRTAAVKARQNAELEVQELQGQLEEVQRLRGDAEDRAIAASRERVALRAQLEENEEELAEVMRKFKASVQQVSLEQASIQEQTAQIAALEAERGQLREQLAELSTRLETMEVDPASSLAQKRLELKVRELESRLELEHTTRTRLEVQIARLKESLEKQQNECDQLRIKEQSAQDAARKLQRQVRELREDLTTSQSRDSEGAQKRRDLEKRAEAAEAETAGARGDLRLALKRIEDLQAAIQGEIDSDTGDSERFESFSEGDSDSSDDFIDTYLVKNKLRSRGEAADKEGASSQTNSIELDISCRRKDSATLDRCRRSKKGGQPSAKK